MKEKSILYIFLASLGLIFFVFLSIPFNYLTENVIGTELTTIVAASFYMLFASLLFLYLFRKLR
ncbi:hypothetical protein [Stygiolobus caldivivus]|uniref:Uncharacterized protein n=1 Tax=Stygiolobus caldivivus TaxID=2824673 RepID=A0A8D5U941_9CREN|nr:hypothetical protein [Stygiolobus caldivivus]BCU71001.1 hypothetical protein KN1_22980 [Stygiolobus caldivivus]